MSGPGPFDLDAAARRFERTQIAVLLVLAALPAVLGRLDVAAGVVGGGLLAGISYMAIKAGVRALAPFTGSAARRRAERRKRAAFVVKFLGRYALLALAAYVMLVRLKVHPVGVLMGVSTPVAAVALEVVRMARSLRRSGRSR